MIVKIKSPRIADIEQRYWRSSSAVREYMATLRFSDLFDWELLLWKMSKNDICDVGALIVGFVVCGSAVILFVMLVVLLIALTVGRAFESGIF